MSLEEVQAEFSGGAAVEIHVLQQLIYSLEAASL